MYRCCCYFVRERETSRHRRKASLRAKAPRGPDSTRIRASCFYACQSIGENIMERVKFALLSLRHRLAGAVFALVASLSVLAAVFAVFASAYGELDPRVANVHAAPAASAVAAQAAVKAAPS